MNLSYRERVLLGIKYLNKAFPNGWIDKIDLSVLDMQSYRKCIIGQLGDGSFQDTFDKLVHLCYDDRVNAFCENDSTNKVDSSGMQAAWIAEITTEYWITSIRNTIM